MKFDKINIYVPKRIGIILETDAELFEIYRSDGRTVNKNRFLSMLIIGYNNKYEEESKHILEDIKKILDGLSDDESAILEKSVRILNEIVRPKVPKRKGKNPIRLSLKPTSETETLINHILNELGDSDYISQYFCRLLMSYCEKPLFEREQIVFSESYRLLSDACSIRQGIMFTTTQNSTNKHYVCPYNIVTGIEEMFNYLLCCEMNIETGDFQSCSYRLCRISKLFYSNKVVDIPEEVLKHLQMMEEYSPAYAINKNVEICVGLTSDGEEKYRRIYFGRPKVDRIEIRGERSFYYFNCSENQAFLYFRRFDGKDAVIVSPYELRKKMKDFHFFSYQKYLEEDEKNGWNI